MKHHLLAIDQGTTNSRAIIFNAQGQLISEYQIPLSQHFPHDGWVEQSPDEMFQHTVICCREVLKKSKLSVKDIAAIGIANQRETTILWDRITGEPVYPAIVWQDRRTVDLCKTFSSIEEMIYQKTGLLLDPYFSGTKVLWILNNVPGVHDKALRGEILFGTVDTYLLWKLTKGQIHATDATNASRTLLFNIHTQKWDVDILKQLNIPLNILPTVLDNTADYGTLDPDILGEKIPIAAMIGDQQAATVGQACFEPGMVKATYGTGAFMLLNTGSEVIQSQFRLLSTIAYRINHKTTYGLEGSIFSAGTTIKWLRDRMHLIENAAETETLARSVTDNNGVYLIPAFNGLGAPYWDPSARGAILGLTQNSGRAHIVRAALESVAYQTRDLLEAMTADSQNLIKIIRVDGGMAANVWLLQFLSDILGVEVERPLCIETTALGAAYLAGLQIGIYQSLDDISKLWHQKDSFLPTMLPVTSHELYDGWKKGIACVLQRQSSLVAY